jgi:hypothetical protein
MLPPNRMSFRPGLLWLTPDLVHIIHCLSRNDTFSLNFKYRIRCVRVCQVEDHCFRVQALRRFETQS